VATADKAAFNPVAVAVPAHVIVHNARQMTRPTVTNSAPAIVAAAQGTGTTANSPTAAAAT
jgi:hypothetical protein